MCDFSVGNVGQKREALPKTNSRSYLLLWATKNSIGQVALKDLPLTEQFASCEARTVDASQGGQWDVVILALTRCNGNTSFVGNANRLNVALSRAKELAVVVGNFQFALKDKHPDSCLGNFAKYVQSNSTNGIRICAPAVNGAIAPSFGMEKRRSSRQQGRREKKR